MVSSGSNTPSAFVARAKDKNQSLQIAVGDIKEAPEDDEMGIDNSNIDESSQDSVQVEKKIQALVAMKKLRITEFFKDFDNLRKGYVSESQFRRVLDQTGVQIRDEEFNLLVQKYKRPDG